MLLILLRHGPAGEADAKVWPDDSQRPLTVRGKVRTRRAAQGLARILEGKVRAILTSPYERCAQTAEIAAEALGCGVSASAALEPGGSDRALLKQIPSLGEDEIAVLVGHEPDLGELAGKLVSRAPARIQLKKAGACGLRFEGPPAVGKGRLEWLLPPRILRQLAREGAREAGNALRPDEDPAGPQTGREGRATGPLESED